MNEYLTMDLVQLWQVVLGTLLPLVIAAVTRQSWSSRAKSATMLAFVVATTAAGMVIDGDLHQPTTAREAVTALFVVFLTSVTTYRNVWKPLGVSGAIERNVNGGPRRAALDDSDDTPAGGMMEPPEHAEPAATVVPLAKQTQTRKYGWLSLVTVVPAVGLLIAELWAVLTGRSQATLSNSVWVSLGGRYGLLWFTGSGLIWGFLIWLGWHFPFVSPNWRQLIALMAAGVVTGLFLWLSYYGQP